MSKEEPQRLDAFSDLQQRNFVVEKKAPRLDAWLARNVPELSRTQIKKLIESGHITVNGTHARPSRILIAGDRVCLCEPPAEKAPFPEPENISLEILYEDEHLVAINKPPGLVVHPGAGHTRGTLVSALLYHYEGRLSSIGGQLRPGIVHRLDKDTSGVLIIARTNLSHLALSRSFATRKVEKHYLAVVAGVPSVRQGVWDGAITRHPVNRKKMTVSKQGRPATTLYRVLDSGRDWSLLHCQILTGRTHQIRVHTSHAGHPILGDEIYGRQASRAARCLLHAAVIRFRHPLTDQCLEIAASIPQDFNAFCSRDKPLLLPSCTEVFFQ